jgi:hypothetical protein
VRVVEVFTASDRSTRLGKDQVLDGGVVLPGFALPVREIFAEPEAAATEPARLPGA